MKYTLISEDIFNGTKVTHEFTAGNLGDVILRIEDFLRGSGFVLGNLQEVEEDTNIKLDYPYDANYFDNMNLSCMADSDLITVTGASDSIGTSFVATGARGDVQR